MRNTLSTDEDICSEVPMKQMQESASLNIWVEEKVFEDIPSG